jgi:predicted AlkP superfamily pyrophosphatase or phosphodiesterase
MRTFTRIFLFIVLIFPAVASCQEQNHSPGFKGKIVNTDSLPLAGVKVIATHVPTGSLYAAETDQNGLYRLPSIQIGGPYAIKAVKPGYRPFTVDKIYLNLGQTITIDVILKTKEAKPKKNAVARSHSVVVLSMDGFRWDYPLIYNTPNLNRMAKSGCKAESLKPSYPTKTFPNHYAIATGLYPDHNGIVQNSFYDPKLERFFRMGDRTAVQDSVFWEGEAIWETAEEQGLRTASYFWVGTESNERYKPDRRKIFESGFPYIQQIDTIFNWLSLPETERPDLVMFYFDEPDKTSHDFGPVSKETGEMVKELDDLVGTLTKGLERIEKKSDIDIDLIIISDHGMGHIPTDQQIFLEDAVDLKKIKRINGGSPVFMLEPEPGQTEEVYSRLKTIPHLKIWKRTDLPVHYHYGTNQRIPELIAEADSSYGLEIRRKANANYSLGMHGYDPGNKDMQGIFYASGPSFKKGFVQPTFENVNIYELLAKLLKIKPAKTDGSLTPVKGMLIGN